MARPEIIKVTLNAVKAPRRSRRVMYDFSGEDVRAPRCGIKIQGKLYKDGEMIPGLVIQIADDKERHELLNRIFYAKKFDSNTQLDFTPHTYVLGYKNPKHNDDFKKMYDWQMNHYGKFLDTLSDEEKKMLQRNRTVAISQMNRFLKADEMGFDPHYVKSVHHGINVMERIIKRSPPLDHDLIVYRGLRKISPENAPPPGGILYAPGFSSTSLNAGISAEDFSDHRSVMRIHVPKGTRLAPISAYQIRQKGWSPQDRNFKTMEHELLLGRQHGFQVTSPIRYNPLTNTHVLDVKLLPQGPQPKGSQVFP